MTETPVDALRRAVEDLHRCEALFTRSVHVSVAVEGRPPWHGLVSIFDLAGHAGARRAYAWSYETGGGAARCFNAILERGAINSAEAAVRASLGPPQRNASAPPELRQA